MRAIRFSGRGRTEAPFSCLFAPTLLTNMLLIMLGSGMTMAVWMLRVFQSVMFSTDVKTISRYKMRVMCNSH